MDVDTIGVSVPSFSSCCFSRFRSRITLFAKVWIFKNFQNITITKLLLLNINIFLYIQSLENPPFHCQIVITSRIISKISDNYRIERFEHRTSSFQEFTSVNIFWCKLILSKWGPNPGSKVFWSQNLLLNIKEPLITEVPSRDVSTSNFARIL